MGDLVTAAAALNKIPNVLAIRPIRGTNGCRVDVLRDTPIVRAAVAKVMARHRLAYEIHLVERSAEHIADVERITRAAHARQGAKPALDNKLPAHTHRARRTGTR